MNPLFRATYLLLDAVSAPTVAWSLLIGVALAAWVAWRAETRRVTRLAATVSVITIVVLTVVRTGGAQGNHWTQRDWWWWAHGWGSMFATNQLVELLANVVLFVPAGLAWRRLGLRSAGVVAGLGGLAFGVEYVQAILGRGAADPRDLVANVVGAALGTAVGSLTMIRRRRDTPQLQGRALARLAWVVVGGFVLIIGLGMGAGEAVAGRRQATLLDQMHLRFDGTTRTQFLEGIDNGEPWPIVEGAFPMTVYLHGENEAMFLRCSVAVLGENRCVFARWREGEPVSYRNAEGNECVEFVDGNTPGSERIDW